MKRSERTCSLNAESIAAISAQINAFLGEYKTDRFISDILNCHSIVTLIGHTDYQTD